MLIEIFLCAAITLLLLLLCWGLAAFVFFPVRGKELYMLLSAAGDGNGLEQQCRAYLFLKGMGVIRRPLLMVDAGLSEEGRRLACRLTELDPQIELCSPEEMERLIRNGD